MDDPRITKLWEVLAKHNSYPRRQWCPRRLWMEYWQDLCEELLRDDPELYRQYIRELVRRAFYE